MNNRNTEQQLRYLEEVCTCLHRAGFEAQPLEDSQLPVYTVTYSPKDPCTGINKYTWGMPNNTFYYTISAKTNEDISWYIGQENVSEYTLKTTAQLFGFAALVNGTAKRADGTLVNSVNFSGKTIYLATTICTPMRKDRMVSRESFQNRQRSSGRSTRSTSAATALI